MEIVYWAGGPVTKQNTFEFVMGLVIAALTLPVLASSQLFFLLFP